MKKRSYRRRSLVGAFIRLIFQLLAIVIFVATAAKLYEAHEESLPVSQAAAP